MSLLTQDGGYEHGVKPGRASAENVNHAPKKLRHWIETEKPTSVAMPKLATGVGGLAWETVRPLIKQHLGEAPVSINLYSTFHKGQKAEEGAGIKAGA